MNYEIVGDLVLASDYWDCECSDGYIHSHSTKEECEYCGVKAEEASTTRLDELASYLLEHYWGLEL